MDEPARKGRHRILSDEVILRAAAKAFAAEGYEAMSVRQLNVDLGLSHETIRQRFGSKRHLYFAAVDLAVEHFYTLLTEERLALGAPEDELDDLRRWVRAFIAASVRFPELSNLVNHEAGTPGERIDYLYRVGFEPGMAFFAEVLDRLVRDEVIYPITIRDAFFLIDAVMSPFSQPGLSLAFDSLAGPLDETTHVDSLIELLFRGLVRPPAPSGSDSSSPPAAG